MSSGKTNLSNSWSWVPLLVPQKMPPVVLLEWRGEAFKYALLCGERDAFLHRSNRCTLNSLPGNCILLHTQLFQTSSAPDKRLPCVTAIRVRITKYSRNFPPRFGGAGNDNFPLHDNLSLQGPSILWFCFEVHHCSWWRRKGRVRQ